jgi:hypothetical protein
LAKVRRIFETAKYFWEKVLFLVEKVNFLREMIGMGNEKAPDARCSRGYDYFWKYTLRGREFSTSPILNVNMKLPSVGN